MQNRFQKVSFLDPMFCSKIQWSPRSLLGGLGSTRVRFWTDLVWIRVDVGCVLCPISGRPIAFLIFLFHFWVDLGPINSPYDHMITRSFDHTIICLHDHMTSWSYDHMITIWSHDHLTIWSYDHKIIWPYDHMITWSYDHMIIWSHDHMLIWSDHMMIWSDHMITWLYSRSYDLMI